MDEVLFETWLKLSLELKEIKKKELEARNALCKNIFKGKVGEFTSKIVDETAAGSIRTIKATSKVNRNFALDELGYDKDELKTTVQSILGDELNLTDAEAACLDVKVEVNVSRFKKIEDAAENLKEILIETAATPTVYVDYKD